MGAGSGQNSSRACSLPSTSACCQRWLAQAGRGPGAEPWPGHCCSAVPNASRAVSSKPAARPCQLACCHRLSRCVCARVQAGAGAGAAPSTASGSCLSRARMGISAGGCVEQGSQLPAGGLRINAKACSTVRSTAAGSPAQRSCQYSPAALNCNCTDTRSQRSCMGCRARSSSACRRWRNGEGTCQRRYSAAY